MKISALVSALGCALGVTAHGGVLQYKFNTTWYWGFVPYNTEVGQTTIQRIWNTYNPIQDVTLETIACNDNGTSPDLQLTATINAGISVTGYWNNPWPHNTGPMLAYLGECPSTGCTGVSPNSLSWFKIAEAGLISGTVYNGTWAAGEMIANNNSWTITIPATVPNGYYLLRMETIALHSQPAQNYPECAQILIQNGGSVKPDSSILVTFPGAYAQTDPGLDIDIYGAAASSQTTYIIPGPTLYPGTAKSSSSTSTITSSSTSSSTSTSTSTTTKTTTTSTTTTTTSTSAGATQTQYGQCGGTGWTGATVCASPYTCTYLNAYYSQCT